MKFKSFLMALMALCALSFAACNKEDDNQDNNNPRTPETPIVSDLSGKAWQFTGSSDMAPKTADTTVSIVLSFVNGNSGFMYVSGEINGVILPELAVSTDFSYSLNNGVGVISSDLNLGMSITFSFDDNGDIRLFVTNPQIPRDTMSFAMQPVQYRAPQSEGINLQGTHWVLDRAFIQAAGLEDCIPPYVSDFGITFADDATSGTIDIQAGLPRPMNIPFSYVEYGFNPYANFYTALADEDMDSPFASFVSFGNMTILRRGSQLFLSIESLETHFSGSEDVILGVIVPLTQVLAN